jgi:hypothetical protein
MCTICTSRGCVDQHVQRSVNMSKNPDRAEKIISRLGKARIRASWKLGRGDGGLGEEKEVFWSMWFSVGELRSNCGRAIVCA